MERKNSEIEANHTSDDYKILPKYKTKENATESNGFVKLMFIS